MKPNYGTLVDPDRYYEVDYTIDQSGKKHNHKHLLKGSDLTEPQIKSILCKWALNDLQQLISKNKAHGGKRDRSGRPKGSIKEPTKVVRIPKSWSKKKVIVFNDDGSVLANGELP